MKECHIAFMGTGYLVSTNNTSFKEMLSSGYRVDGLGDRQNVNVKDFKEVKILFKRVRVKNIDWCMKIII